MLSLTFPVVSSATLLRPRLLQYLIKGVGILTDFPSPTPFGLGLGPDYPREDDPAPGNLGFSANVFLTRFIATHCDILSCRSSSRRFRRPSMPLQCSSTAHVRRILHEPEASVPGLAPLHLRRRTT